MLQRRQRVSIWRVIWTVAAVLIAIIWLVFFFPETGRSDLPTAEDASNTASSAAKNDVAEKPE